MGWFSWLFGKKAEPKIEDEAPDAAAAQSNGKSVASTIDAQPQPAAKTNIAPQPAPPAPAAAKNGGPAKTTAPATTKPAPQSASPSAQAAAPAQPQASKPKPVASGGGAALAAGAGGGGAVAAREAPQSGDLLVDDILSALDAAFDPGAAPSVAQQHNEEIQDDGVNELFANIAATYAQPLKDFIYEVEKGTATKDWIDICRPALRSINQAARSMQMMAAAERMEDLDVALHQASQSTDPKLTPQLRQNILERYRRLVEVMPKAFGFGQEQNHREGMIIQSLLKQIPEIGRVTLDKMYAAGLTSFDSLLKAKREELAVATGISGKVAEEIISKVQQYDKEQKTKSSGDIAEYKQRLTRLVGALKTAHEAFEKASAGDNNDEKRKQRTARQNFVFQISIVLAELGEVELAKELDKQPFDRRIQTLEDYLKKMSGKKK